MNTDGIYILVFIVCTAVIVLGTIVINFAMDGVERRERLLEREQSGTPQYKAARPWRSVRLGAWVFGLSIAVSIVALFLIAAHTVTVNDDDHSWLGYFGPPTHSPATPDSDRRGHTPWHETATSAFA